MKLSQPVGEHWCELQTEPQFLLSDGGYSSSPRATWVEKWLSSKIVKTLLDMTFRLSLLRRLLNCFCICSSLPFAQSAEKRKPIQFWKAGGFAIRSTLFLATAAVHSLHSPLLYEYETAATARIFLCRVVLRLSDLSRQYSLNLGPN